MNGIGDMQALILCGGLGTRFRPVRDDIPKILAPIGGRPFFDILVEQLGAQGIRHFVFATGHLHQQVADYCHGYFCQGDRAGWHGVVSQETSALGTAGAIRQAADVLEGDRFFVLNGDSSVALDLAGQLALHLRAQPLMTLLLSSATQGQDYGNVEIDKESYITRFTEKPENPQDALINAGVYCVERRLLEQIPAGENLSLEKDLIPQLVARRQVVGHVVSAPVRDIGTPERYQAINKIYENGSYHGA